MKIYKKQWALALGFLLAGSAVRPSSKIRDFYNDHKKPIIAAGAGAGFLAGVGLLYGIIKFMVTRSIARLRQTDAKRSERLQAKLDDLTRLYEALPTQDFRRVADEKIAQVREQLALDVEIHKQSARDEFAALKREQEEVAALIAQEHQHLRTVEAFLRSVEQSSGGVFVNRMTTMKRDIEYNLGVLERAGNDLKERMSAAQARISGQKATLEMIDLRIMTLSGKITELEQFVRSQDDLRATVMQAREQEQIVKREADQMLETIKGAQKDAKKRIKKIKKELISLEKEAERALRDDKLKKKQNKQGTQSVRQEEIVDAQPLGHVIALPVPTAPDYDNYDEKY